MPAFTILFGVALMAVGIATYTASEEQPSALLLPIIFGLVAMGLGVGSIVKKDLRMHLMHGAVLIAALGVLIPVIQLVMRVVTMWQCPSRQVAVTHPTSKPMRIASPFSNRSPTGSATGKKTPIRSRLRRCSSIAPSFWG